MSKKGAGRQPSALFGLATNLRLIVNVHVRVRELLYGGNHMLRPGILTTFHLPVQDHSYPALALGGITVYPSTLIIVRFPPQLVSTAALGALFDVFEIAANKETIQAFAADQETGCGDFDQPGCPSKGVRVRTKYALRIFSSGGRLMRIDQRKFSDQSQPSSGHHCVRQGSNL